MKWIVLQKMQTTFAIVGDKKVKKGGKNIQFF